MLSRRVLKRRNTGNPAHRCCYSAGLTPSLLTWMRNAVILSFVPVWAMRNTYSPGRRSDRSPGTVVMTDVPAGTRTFCELPFYSRVSSCPSAAWTTAATLALVIIVSGCRSQGA